MLFVYINLMKIAMDMKDFKQVTSESKPTLVDFYAKWCGPCKMQHPEIDKVERNMGDKVNVLMIDVDEDVAIANAYGIRSIPTLMIFVDGMVQWRNSGVHRAELIENKLKEYTD